jgi:hypothetical protein
MFSKKIDLLFLDAWDVDLINCAEKHLEAYNTAKKKPKKEKPKPTIDNSHQDVTSDNIPDWLKYIKWMHICIHFILGGLNVWGESELTILFKFYKL